MVGKELSEQELGRIVSSINIPPCPTILVGLAAEIRSTDPNFNKIEQLIIKDVGLSATLLKTVNSPFYGLRTKVGTVKQALNMLGLSTLSQTVTGLVLRNTFVTKDKLGMVRFWDTSTKIALSASYLAKQLPGVSGDEAYSFGLFQNCGIPLLMQKFPTYKQMLGLGNDTENRSFTHIEDEAHGTDHATIGYLLTKSWNLPESLTTAIRFHHEYETLSEANTSISPTSRNLIALGQLAEHVVNLHSGLGYSKELSKGGEAAMSYFRLTATEFEEICQEVTEHLD
ncbi:HDOD domain-containing protein [Propionivibrio sp.]|uniref:HDOD domain-containing protein n=1 Tax=Propionivibrio sp. TaxID=2212460 RepID=UPI003BF44FE7